MRDSYSSKPPDMSNIPGFLMLLIFTACTDTGQNNNLTSNTPCKSPGIESIAAIPLPAGYERVKAEPGSFTEWLRNICLKKNNLVFLYNGTLKRNQSLHFAVLDLPIGQKDLQQCADALMRLRADYLFDQKRYGEIQFRDNTGKIYQWTKQDNREGYAHYLENVFGWCNSASLEKQLKPVAINEIQPGDVFIKGGFPGHAMMVADVAINDSGKKIFTLLQSFMPAQDIHIVKNLWNADMSPWYEVDQGDIITPGWIFKKEQLRRW